LECSMARYAMILGEGGLPLPAKESSRSCRDWIVVQPESFSLSPGGQTRVSFRIRVPRECTGGYYAIVSCTGVQAKSKAEESGAESSMLAGIHFSYQNLIPVLLTAPGGRLEARLNASQPVLALRENGRDMTFAMSVFNQGNVHARVTGAAEIRSEDKQLVQSLRLGAGKGVILPDSARSFVSQTPIDLPDGAYYAEIRLDVEKSSRPMSQLFPFYVRNGKPVVGEVTDEIREKFRTDSSGFLVSPIECASAFRAGGRRNDTIEIRNLTGDTIPVRVTLMEWERGADGRDRVVATPPAHGRSVKDLINIGQKEISLEPRGRRRVQVVYSLPKRATGEYYGAVVFDRPDLKLSGAPEEVARRSSLVRIVAQGTGTIAASVENFRAAVQPDGGVRFSLRLRNTGTVSFRPAIDVLLRDAAQQTVGKINPPSETLSLIQAGGQADVSLNWTQILSPGTYRAQITVTSDPNKPPLVQNTEFVMPKVAMAHTAAAEAATSGGR